MTGIRRLIVRLLIAATGCMVAFSMLSTTTATAAVAGSDPRPTAASMKPVGMSAAFAHTGLSPVGADAATSILRPAALCSFRTDGDRVHISGTEASGHGWWINVNCRPGTKAVVTVQLQELKDGDWKNVGTVGKATVLSGGGRGKRATGRAACVGTAEMRWRSVVDVNLVGALDDPFKFTTGEVPLPCSH